ncbi:MAG TPA: translation initiation factor IF-1 [Verrucomicrobiota bacterium]|nr:translation initiation factor IF-1 [Verrucomicrobiota bacterium]HNT13334.1 translation initiation factor IF-1 [Verrucomicrobiota bacterium]
MCADAFRVEGRVIAALPNGTFRVELANGHQVLAFAAGRQKYKFAGVQPGDRVTMQLTPFDLSTGRLVDGELS